MIKRNEPAFMEKEEENRIGCCAICGTRRRGKSERKEKASQWEEGIEDERRARIH